jgi:RNA polymerase sigma-70 factor (ECF subfamily)
MPLIHREDDAPLVEACLNMDTSAWDRLTRKYSALILTAATNRLKKYGFEPLREDMEDIRQSVLAAIFERGKLEAVRNRKSLACWIAIVSGNAALEYMRKKIASGEIKTCPLQDDIPIEAKNTETPDNNEFLRAVELAVDSLHGKEKLIAKLNILHGMGYHDIAQMLGLPKGTVSSYIKRAREKLKRTLRDFR